MITTARITIGLLLACCCASALPAVPSSASYRYGGKVYEYTLTATGENYTFEFKDNPGAVDDRLAVVWHVLQTVYGDSSIPARHGYFFMKEGAKCFVYDASLYTYNACFLPNEYSPGHRERFWGFVTRLRSGWWLVSRNLIPAALALGICLYYLFR